jgi:N-acetylglucosamine-6-phosphate deacetylase
MKIEGALVYNTFSHSFDKKTVSFDKGVFIASPCSGEAIDADGLYMVPGFIDIHTHGGNNIDVNHVTKESFPSLSAFYAEHGVTSFLASVMTDREETTLSLLRVLGLETGKNSYGAELLGIHLEGPFISCDYKGAMPEELLRKPDAALLEKYCKEAGDHVRYLTLAPELEGSVELIREFKSKFPIAIGHSAAEYDTAMDAIKAGAEACTHTFNAMKLFHMHRPAISGAVLESDVYAEAICDGFHLHPATVRLLLKTKGYDRVVGISDSIMAAGLPDGHYQLGVNEVFVKDGDAKLSNGVRAGSTLTLDRALRNLVAFTGEKVEKVLPLLTENPAKLIRVFDRKGSIEVGKDADFVLLDKDLNIVSVFVGGRETYRRK